MSALRARALDGWRGVDSDVRAGARALGVSEQPVADHARCASVYQVLPLLYVGTTCSHSRLDSRQSHRCSTGETLSPRSTQ